MVYSTLLAVWCMMNLSLANLGIWRCFLSLCVLIIFWYSASSVPDPSWVISSMRSNMLDYGLSIKSSTS